MIRKVNAQDKFLSVTFIDKLNYGFRNVVDGIMGCSSASFLIKDDLWDCEPSEIRRKRMWSMQWCGAIFLEAICLESIKFFVKF